MSWWRRKGSADRPEPEQTSEKERLAQLLNRVADDIDADGDDAISRRWSSQVRTYAAQIGAGSSTGLRNFLGGFLFDPDPRNTVHDQPFAQTSTLDEARRLATKLLKEHKRDTPRYSHKPWARLRPWKEGSTGKGVIYEDGTVVATEDGSGGDPHIAEIKAASRPDEEPVATIAIRPNGSCAVYRYKGDMGWLADRLHEHNPLLRLERSPPRAG